MALTGPTIDAPGFFGMRTHDSYTADEVEPSFLKTRFELKPNSDILIGGLAAMMPSYQPDNKNARFDWFEDVLENISAAAALYEEETLTTPIAVGTNVAADHTVYAEVPAAFANHCRERLEVRLSETHQHANDRVGIITKVIVNGAASVVAIRMMEAAAAPLCNAVDLIRIIGNVNPDGSHRPDPQSSQSRQRWNLAQTVRTAIKIDRRTALQQYRSMDDAWKKESTKALDRHLRQIEGMLIHGARVDTTMLGDRMTLTQGIIPALRANVPAHEVSFYNSVDTDFAGKSWADAGPLFIDQALALAGRYGGLTKTCICGRGFLYGMNRIARNEVSITVETGFTEYGQQVTRWIAPGIVVNFKDYEEFTNDPHMYHSGLFFDASNIRRYVITDTRQMNKLELNEASESVEGFDGAIGGWLTDMGLVHPLLETMFLMHGCGQNNATYVP